MTCIHCSSSKITHRLYDNVSTVPKITISQINQRRRSLLFSALITSLPLTIAEKRPSFAIQSIEEPIDVFNRCASSVVAIATLDQSNSSKVVASGIVWDSLGHIITSYSAINPYIRQQQQLFVQSSSPATVIARDPSLDLLILKIDIENTSKSCKPVSSLIKSSTASIGQDVYIIGSTADGTPCLSAGVLSAVQRSIPAPNGQQIRNVLQTDADVSILSVGGGAFTSSGELIGMPTSSFAKSTLQNKTNGVNFAISSDVLLDAVPGLILYGTASRKREQ